MKNDLRAIIREKVWNDPISIRDRASVKMLEWREMMNGENISSKEWPAT